jgi:cell division protease FtsH
MVCDWGMSTLGPVAFGENQDTVFLGREISRNQNYSEETARKIDAEVHMIIDEQYQRAKTIVLEKRSALDKIAEALLEYETIDGKHVQEILDFGEIRSTVIREVPPVVRPEDKNNKKLADKPAQDGGLGGAAAPSPTPA